MATGLTDQDFANWYTSLSPTEQQQFNYTFGMSPQDQFGDAQSGFPTQAMPDMGADLGSLISGNQPQLTTKGKVDPLDLSQLAQRLNYTQDVGGSMFDVAQALFAGPDAWGDPKQFEPTISYSGTPVAARQLDDGTYAPVSTTDTMLDDYIANGGYEAEVAKRIKEGKTPSRAVAEVREIVTKGANATDPKIQAQVADIRNTMPVRLTQDDLGKTIVPDRATAELDDAEAISFATGLYKDKTQEGLSAQTLNFDPQSGLFYPQMKTEDSAASLKFRNAGLPTPNERFDDPAYIEKAFQAQQPGYQADDADRQQTLAAGLQGLSGKVDEAGKASANQQQLMKAWQDTMPQQHGPVTSYVPGQPQYAPLPAQVPTGGAGPFGSSRGMPKPAPISATPALDAATSMFNQQGQAPSNPLDAQTSAFAQLQAAQQQQQSQPQQPNQGLAQLMAGRQGMNQPPQQQGPNFGSIQPTMYPGSPWQDQGQPFDTTALRATPRYGPADNKPRPPVNYDFSGNATLTTDKDALQRRVMASIGDIFGSNKLGPEGKPGGMGRLNQGDINNAKSRTSNARRDVTSANNAWFRAATSGNSGAPDRAALLGQLMGQARSGQTPLQVAMLARLASLKQRAGI